VANYLYNNFYDATTTAAAWSSWNSSSTTATFMDNSVWQNWSSGTTAGTNYIVQRPTSEQQERYEEQRREQQERYQQQRLEREAAEQRAQELLMGCLNEEQTEQMSRNRRFRVRGSRGGVYEITHGAAYQLNEEGRRTHAICIHGSGIPEGDNMLAKKLMLETDEESFRRIGNFSRVA
jgi:hypothetical protein